MPSAVDETAFHALISGRRRGLVPGLLRGGLRTLACPYELAVRTRNRAYDSGLLKIDRAPVPVVSVGNITTGGTGKTPFVAHLARWFQNRGCRVVILSRGYKAIDEEHNDEKLVLDRLCPGVVHLQNRDRVASARRAYSEFDAEVLLLDDGFQHRRLHRDLDVVLLDGMNPFGYGRLLPRGLLREPLTGLRRAGLFVLTRADHLDEQQKADVAGRLAQYAGPRAEKLVQVAFPPERLVNAGNETAGLDSLAGRSIAAFCGIGNPEGFRGTVKRMPGRVVHFSAYMDHHRYTPADLERIGREAEQAGADVLLTTEKDLVKLEQVQLGSLPLWAVRIGLEPLSNAAVLESRLEAVLQGG